MAPVGRGPQFKKRRTGPRLIPVKHALIGLSKQELRGQLHGDVVKIRVNTEAALLLQSADVGRPDQSQLPQLEPGQRHDRNKPWPAACEMPLLDAFFAQHVLGCLTVTRDSDDGAQLSSEELWTHCIENNKDFAQLYACYLHYRSKGWIVRNGIDFGAHFVVYRAHPSQVHAEWSVLVRTALPGGSGSVQWLDISITNRVCIQVRKLFLVVSILQPPDLDTSLPECVSQMAIDERRMARWTVIDGYETRAGRVTPLED